MLNMLKGLEKKVDAFRITYKCKSPLSINNEDTVLYLITAKAYNHDPMWFTLRKSGSVTRIDNNNKAKVIKWLQEEIENYINNGFASQADFDKWHESICKKLADRINKEVLFGYKPVCIGKAQKIINMSFKYLSSLDGADKYEQRFEYCHLPIDSNILDWYYSNIATGVRKSKQKNWSNLGYDDYKKIQEDFRIYCKTAKKIPLAFEWEIF